MTAPRATLLLTLTSLALGACSRQAPPDLTARVLFTATGAYDAQADQRERLGAGQRRALWQARPPLPGTSVTVEYNSEARPVSWAVTVQGAAFTAQDLARENPTPRAVPDVKGQLFTSGRLNDVLVQPVPGGLQLVTRGYATQYRSDLLPLFGPR